jgi:hypothetical protein
MVLVGQLPSVVATSKCTAVFPWRGAQDQKSHSAGVLARRSQTVSTIAIHFKNLK